MLSTWLRYVSVLNQRDLCKSFAFLVILLLINDDIVLLEKRTTLDSTPFICIHTGCV